MANKKNRKSRKQRKAGRSADSRIGQLQAKAAGPGRSRRQQRRQSKHKRQRIIALVVVAGVLLLAGAALFWPRQAAPEVAQERLIENPILGPEDAPVTLTEFGDFACSACRSWHQAGVIFQIMDQFEGLVRYEWRDFPIITPDSPKAAEAGQCAHDQGRFWDYLDHIYTRPGSSYTNVRQNDLRRYAEEISLDMQAFESCLDSNQHQATVEFDLAFARSQGFGGTPSFSVNGTPVIGGDPSLLIQAIQQALANN